MASEIFQRAPLWVWPLLGFLIFLGWRQSKPSSMGPARATIAPIAMACMSLYGVSSSFGQTQPWSLAAWALALCASAGAALAFGVWGGIEWSDGHGHVALPGSWWPMAAILGIFCAKFATQAAMGMRPGIQNELGFALAASCAYGAFSGMFLSRGVAMIQAVRHGARPRA